MDQNQLKFGIGITKEYLFFSKWYRYTNGLAYIDLQKGWKLSENCPGYNMVTCAPIRAKQLDCFSLVRRVATVVMPQYGLLPLIPKIHVI